MPTLNLISLLSIPPRPLKITSLQTHIPNIINTPRTLHMILPIIPFINPQTPLIKLPPLLKITQTKLNIPQTIQPISQTNMSIPKAIPLNLQTLLLQPQSFLKFPLLQQTIRYITQTISHLYMHFPILLLLNFKSLLIILQSLFKFPHLIIPRPHLCDTISSFNTPFPMKPYFNLQPLSQKLNSFFKFPLIQHQIPQIYIAFPIMTIILSKILIIHRNSFQINLLRFLKLPNLFITYSQRIQTMCSFFMIFSIQLFFYLQFLQSQLNTQFSFSKFLIYIPQMIQHQTLLKFTHNRPFFFLNKLKNNQTFFKHPLFDQIHPNLNLFHYRNINILGQIHIIFSIKLMNHSRIKQSNFIIKIRPKFLKFYLILILISLNRFKKLLKAIKSILKLVIYHLLK